MQGIPQFSQSDIESELNRIAAKPLAQYIDGVSSGIDALIQQTELSPLAEQFPCPCCKGAGWLYTASDLYTLDMKTGKLEPLKKPGGGAVRMGGNLNCPRCMGMQFDFVAWIEAQQKQARGVAA